MRICIGIRSGEPALGEVEGDLVSFG